MKFIKKLADDFNTAWGGLNQALEAVATLSGTPTTGDVISLKDYRPS